jgi:heat shock protein HtpX
VAWLGAWSVLVTVPFAVVRGDPVPLLLSGLLVVVPTVVTLAQLSLSRSREYDADVDAIALTRDPEGLATALLALDSIEGRIWERILVGRSGPPDVLLLLLRTHPPTDERVRRLHALVPTRRDQRPLSR